MNTITKDFNFDRMINSLILNTDSYKPSQWLQYPPNTDYIESYGESRGGKYDYTIFFGLQIFIKEYLLKSITQEDIEDAEVFWKLHGEPFNREGWQYILDKHNGYLPLKIMAVPEGTKVPTGNILYKVINTDKNCAWLTSYVETALLRAVWYPTTVATNSYSIKRVIKKFLETTTDNLNSLPFKLHDFGARGVSSKESAGIGGAAHLVNFMGSDNVTGILYSMKYYNSNELTGFSVPASEHSTITAWLREGEKEAYRNMIKQFGGKYPIFSVVSDSYDIFNAANLWAEMKDEIIRCGSMLVIRPDSGDPVQVVTKLILLLDAKFGHTINSKGYRVLNHVRILQGDGIEESTIEGILNSIRGFNFSADNIVFGMGGALLQKVDRDTQKFAQKASAGFIDGRWIDIFKDPVTDQVKKSKKGRLMLYRDLETGEIYTATVKDPGNHTCVENMLFVVYENGKLIKEYTFNEVRANSEKGE